MANFFYVLTLVFDGAFIVSLIVAAVFAGLATKIKKQSMEEKYKSAKRKSYIFEFVALGCLIFGILCWFLFNHYF